MALSDLASQILDFTRITTNADSLAPGKPFRVDVVPGVLPALPSVSDVAKLALSNVTIEQGQLSGTVVGTITGNVVGDITGALRVLPHDVKVSVTPSITRNGEAWVAPTATPSPLSFAFLLVPTISAESLSNVPTQYEIVLDVEVAVSTSTSFTGATPPVETATVTRTFTIPVDVPSIEFPAVLLMGRHPNFDVTNHGGNDAGWLLVLVRGGSILKSAGDVVHTLNTLMQTIRDLQTVLGWGDALGLFVGELQYAVNIINRAPTIFFFVAGARDMGDFDDEASASLLIGTTGTTVEIYSQGNFNADSGEHEHTTITLEDFGTQRALPISMGVGVDRKLDLSTVDWDTDQGDRMNDHVESVKFEAPSQPFVSTPTLPPQHIRPEIVVKIIGGRSPHSGAITIAVNARDPIMRVPLDGAVSFDAGPVVGRTNRPIDVALSGTRHTAHVTRLGSAYADVSVLFDTRPIVDA